MLYYGVDLKNKDPLDGRVLAPNLSASPHRQTTHPVTITRLPAKIAALSLINKGIAKHARMHAPEKARSCFTAKDKVNPMSARPTPKMITSFRAAVAA